MARQWSIEFDVSSSLPFVGEHAIRGTVHAPAALDGDRPVTVLYCIAGGGCTSAYFDLDVPGHSGYSMARHLADAGHIVVTVDHPGIGASDRVDDVYALTPWHVAAAHHAACAQLAGRLDDGSLGGGLGRVPNRRLVGVGHSMGGMLIDVQQGAHRTYDAVCPLGASGLGLPDFLSAEALATSTLDRDDRGAALARVAHDMFTNPKRSEHAATPLRFFADDVPAAVIAAFAAQQTTLLYSCGLAAMVPGLTNPEREVIEVPVFLALGDQDLVTDDFGAAALYAAAIDVTVYRLIGSGHCHNQAGSRALLWDRLDRWIRALA